MKDFIEKARKEGRTSLNELESKELLAEYGIKAEIGWLVKSLDDLEKISEELEYPVVMKVLSNQILHKSDVGGVRINIGKDELRDAFEDIMNSVKQKAPDADIEGILVQKMHRGHETIVGMYRDQQFGPVVMFGLGGIFVEILKDVSFRLPPLSKDEAMEMIKEIRGYPVLEGARGGEKANLNSLSELISRFSEFVMDFESIKEVDLNPVMVNEKQAVVIDARIIFE